MRNFLLEVKSLILYDVKDLWICNMENSEEEMRGGSRFDVDRLYIYLFLMILFVLRFLG